jgi:gluconolactonase
MTQQSAGRRFPEALLCAFLVLPGCSTTDPDRTERTLSVPTVEAELIASDPAWGNTEGPAVDSNGVLYFTSRGAFKGIVRWTSDRGAVQFAEVASMAGPGGLWIDKDDAIHLTATDERQVQVLAVDGNVRTVASHFEADKQIAKGPNDITVSGSGIVYFTDPNGYYGESEPGTVYWIDADGAVQVFDDTVVGPNGIVLSADDRTLYVANNVAETTSNLVRWPLAGDGSAAGPKQIVARVEPCVADGMAVDAEGMVWLTCYSYGTAHRIDTATGATVELVKTAQKALTNAVFGRGDDADSLYLTSSDMERVTGYVYRARVATPGAR